MYKKLFNNTGKLTKFILKRERIYILVWIVLLTILTLAVAVTFADMYSDYEALQGMHAAFDNPALIAMVGPYFGEAYTFGVMFSQNMLLFTAIGAGVMSIFLVIRNTRKDEDYGRTEVIRSLPVGRLSNLLATINVVVIINVLLTLITGFGLFALGINEMPLCASLIYGASLGIIGIFFGAVAALFSQASATSRGAMGYSFMFLGVLYLVRAAGDVGENILAYISPLGLVLRAAPFAYNNLWPLLVIAGLSVVGTLIAFYFNSIRDLGAGLTAAKPGRREASVFLQSPFGLAMRLLKGTLIGWGLTIFILGASYGSIFGDIETLLDDNEMMQQMFLGEATIEELQMSVGLEEQFLTTIVSMFIIMLTVPILIILLKIYSEEKKGRLENIYAKKVSRSKMLKSYLLIALGSSIDFVLLFTFGLWLAAFAVMAEPLSLVTVLLSGLLYLPAVWFMIGLTLFLIGVAPKLIKLVWAYLGASLFIVYLGGALQLPEWLASLTPFGHISQYPVESVAVLPLVILTLAAIGMCVIGFSAYNKRDIA